MMIKSVIALILMASPAIAHDIRQNDIVTQVIEQRGEHTVLVTQYSNAEAVEVLVECEAGVADFLFKSGNYLINKRGLDNRTWTATWKDGRSLTDDTPPSVYTFACHTH